MNRRSAAGRALCLLVAVIACSRTTAVPPDELSWPDGVVAIDQAPWPPEGTSVLLFLADDCPIAGRYAPTVQTLVRDSPQFSWYAVYDAATHSEQQARDHLSDFALPLRPLLDGGELRRVLAARRTPTAVVLQPNGDAAGFQLLYRGRIDNWYEDFGRRRAQPTTADLAEALQHARDQRPAPSPWPEPVGCSISDSDAL